MPRAISDRSALFMLQLWLDIPRLMELGRALHLPIERTDYNYIIHCALREAFGDIAPAPFSVENSVARNLRVLAYSPTPPHDLETRAQSFASPMGYSLVDWTRFAAKPMPSSFKNGTRLGFELRACPVVRMASSGKHHRAGAEVDAFVARAWEVDDPKVSIDREDVYRSWLVGQFDRQDAAIPHSIILKRFSLETMVRRGHGDPRQVAFIKRPSVTLAGNLEVTDSDRFSDLLRCGIGRHKSFGFGMLKVSQPGG